MKQQTYQVTDSIHRISFDDDSTVYDIVLDNGEALSFNAYVIRGSKKTAVVDTVPASFSDDYIDRLSEVTAIEDIDYVIVNHSEPDVSGAIADILAVQPEATVVATADALANLRHILNINFKSMRAREQMKLSLGDETLMFYMKPHLDWPGTMFTHAMKDDVLFTGDFLSAHVTSDRNDIRNEAWSERHQEFFKAFYDHFFSPHKPFVIKATRLLDELKPKTLAPSHGPLMDAEVMDAANKLYRRWAKPVEQNGRPLVIIPYASAHGYTKKIGAAIREGILEVYDDDVDVDMYDLAGESLPHVIGEIDRADAFLIGTNTMWGDAPAVVWDLIAALNPNIHGKKLASVFGSYGWSGEAVKFVMDRLKQLKMILTDGLRIRLNPSERQISDARDFGRRFGRFMKDKMRLA